MVLMSTLLNNIKELVNQYVYTKEETRENFDYFIEHNVRYINGQFVVNEDMYLYYDDGSSDKSANYSFILNNMNATLTYDSTNQYYVFAAQQSSANGSLLKLGEIDVQNCEISIDFLWHSGNASSGGYNATMKLSDSTYSFNNSTYIGTWSNNKVIGTVVDGTDYRQKPSNRLNMNTWYTFKAIINNDEVTSQIILRDSDTIIASATTPMMNVNKIGIYTEIDYVASTNYFTNFKVKRSDS